MAVLLAGGSPCRPLACGRPAVLLAVRSARRPPGNAVGLSSSWQCGRLLVLLASGDGAGPGACAGEGPAASEASPGVSTSLRRRRGMAPSRRFRATAFILRRGAPLTGRPVVLLVLGSAPRSGHSARSRSAESRVELAPRAPRDETSTAASGSAQRSAAGLGSAPDERLRRHRARARRKRSLPGAAAEPKTRRTTGRPDSRAPRCRMNAVARCARSLRRFGSGATAPYLASFGGSC